MSLRGCAGLTRGDACRCSRHLSHWLVAPFIRTPSSQWHRAGYRKGQTRVRWQGLVKRQHGFMLFVTCLDSGVRTNSFAFMYSVLPPLHIPSTICVRPTTSASHPPLSKSEHCPLLDSVKHRRVEETESSAGPEVSNLQVGATFIGQRGGSVSASTSHGKHEWRIASGVFDTEVTIGLIQEVLQRRRFACPCCPVECCTAHGVSQSRFSFAVSTSPPSCAMNCC